MTYRDDHDAAIARAEALQADLERSEAERARAEAERDRLRDKVDRLEHQPGALVAPFPTALTTDEVDRLLVQVDAAARRQQPIGKPLDKRVVLAVVAGGGVVTLLGAAISLTLCALGGLAIVTAIVLSLATGTGGGNQPGEVAKALREAPETITDVRITREGVVVETSTDTLEVTTTARGDLERRLLLRCPNAKVT